MATITTEHPSAARPPAGPERGPGWRKRWPLALAAVAILVVIALLWLVLGHDSGPSGGSDRGGGDRGGDTRGEVVVPAVVGKPEAEARSVLEAKGLKVTTEQEAQSRVGTDGMVISQKPGALAYASAGDTVTLLVGHENAPDPTPAPVTMPDVVNTPVESAVNALQAGNLAVSIAPPADSVYVPGLVAYQSPAPGTPLPAGTGVTIVPASGYTTVPDLGGMCLVDARNTLQAAGLHYSGVT